MGREIDPVPACALSGSDHAAQIDRWRALLAGATVTRSELRAQVGLDAGLAPEAASLVRDEQQCCPFLAFRLDFHGASVTLTISAPGVEAVRFLDALVSSASSLVAPASPAAETACCDTCAGPAR
jgi:hypothetical protein